MHISSISVNKEKHIKQNAPSFQQLQRIKVSKLLKEFSPEEYNNFMSTINTSDIFEKFCKKNDVLINLSAKQKTYDIFFANYNKVKLGIWYKPKLQGNTIWKKLKYTLTPYNHMGYSDISGYRINDAANNVVGYLSTFIKENISPKI